MLDLITFAGKDEVNERSALSVRVSFNDSDARAKAVPSNIYYRVDDDGTGCNLADWTPVTPVPVLPTNYVDIVVTPEQNRVLRESVVLERKTLTVMVDRDLATQTVNAYTYGVRNCAFSS